MGQGSRLERTTTGPVDKVGMITTLLGAIVSLQWIGDQVIVTTLACTLCNGRSLNIRSRYSMIVCGSSRMETGDAVWVSFASRVMDG